MGAIHHETWIRASRTTVFDALTTRAGLDAWWGRAVSAEPKVGHVVEFDHQLGSPLLMRVTELVPEQRVCWRCVSDYTDTVNPASEWLGTRLVFDLRDARADPAAVWLAPKLGYDPGLDEPLTIVDFRHTDWPDGARWLPFCNAGWGQALAALGQHCEGRG